ncbi:hypothetical protein YC2023_054266 [Brassica napus]
MTPTMNSMTYLRQFNGITRLTTRRARTYQTRELHEKPTSYRELPREKRPQTLNATVPTASYKYPERFQAKNQNTGPKQAEIKETTDGTRRNRKPTMPSFSGIHRRLPPPLHPTVTVYTHLTASHIERQIGDWTTLRRRQNHSRTLKPLSNCRTTQPAQIEEKVTEQATNADHHQSPRRAENITGAKPEQKRERKNSNPNAPPPGNTERRTDASATEGPHALHHRRTQ